MTWKAKALQCALRYSSNENAVKYIFSLTHNLLNGNVFKFSCLFKFRDDSWPHICCSFIFPSTFCNRFTLTYVYMFRHSRTLLLCSTFFRSLLLSFFAFFLPFHDFFESSSLVSSCMSPWYVFAFPFLFVMIRLETHCETAAHRKLPPNYYQQAKSSMSEGHTQSSQ